MGDFCHRFWRVLLLATTAGSLVLSADLPAPGLGAAEPATPDNPADARFRQISDNVYGLGLVQLDKQKRTLSFPAVVNMSEGVVEYALVHATGKVHESVLKTDADPLHIHLGSLLLAPPDVQPPPPGPKPSTPRELLGPGISIQVQWNENGSTQRVRLENLISNTLTKGQMTPGDWIYSGSRVVDGTFLAQRDGSIVSIIADPDALVNNPRPGRDDDEIWLARSSAVPGVGTAVEVIFELPKRPIK